MKEGEANGTGVEMTIPVERGLDEREPRFHAMPQPALPDKDYGATPFTTGFNVPR
jgi:hypothetical protein